MENPDTGTILMPELAADDSMEAVIAGAVREVDAMLDADRAEIEDRIGLLEQRFLPMELLPAKRDLDGRVRRLEQRFLQLGLLQEDPAKSRDASRRGYDC